MNIAHQKLASLISEKCGDEVCSRDFIRDNAIFTHKNPGVYFLLKDGEIVYIGQSVDPEARIPAHRVGSTGKDFDSYYVHRCRKEDLDLLETLFILHYTPILNGTPATKQNTVVSDRGVKQVLVESGLALKHFNRWRRKKLISPIAEMPPRQYSLKSDVVSLIDCYQQESA